MSIYEVASKLTEDLPFDGITISGGEPLQQIEPLLAFLSLYQAEFSPSTTIIMYSGYTKDQIRASRPLVSNLRSLGIDAIICGRGTREGLDKPLCRGFSHLHIICHAL